MNARVTILQDTAAIREEAAPPETASDVFDAEIVATEQLLMELSAPRPVDRGAALRIDTGDAIWLGEVENCAPSGGGFAIRVRLRHVLRDFETLARLAERFGGASAFGVAGNGAKGKSGVAPTRAPATI